MNLPLTHRPFYLFVLFLTVGLLAVCANCPARAASSNPDTLIFTNGDHLSGTLDNVTGGKVSFKSANAGTVQVAWKDIKELHTSTPFAVIETSVTVRRKQANANVPVGTISVNADTLTVETSSGAQEIPVSKIAYIVDEATYRKNVEHGQKLLQGITGSISAGASTVNSTQNSVAINTAVVLSRAVPPVAWMPPRYRTLLNFTSSYGKVTQPATPTVKTSILHAGIEEDKYFNPRFYLLGQAMWDHNFSQGLDLQQLYGGGAGYTAIKNDKQELDVTGIIDYTKQQFAASATSPATSINLIGSSFGDNYMRKLPKKIVFTEIAVFNPAWNHPSDYSANIAAGATFPLFKNFGLSAGIVDSYLNDPPAGFKGNSFQFTAGLSYSIQ